MTHCSLLFNPQNPYCIVIVNINFDQIFTPRNGGEADFRNIENLLSKSARFQTVKIHRDCTRIQVLEIIEDIAKSEEISKSLGAGVRVNAFFNIYIGCSF